MPFLAVLVCALLGGSNGPLLAQDGGWNLEGEVGGALFFGNTSQTTLSTRLATGMEDSVREFSADGRFSYGQARNEDGESFVNKRSWKIGTSYTHEPSERFSAFLSSDLEGSYERRIDFRYDLSLPYLYRAIAS